MAFFLHDLGSDLVSACALLPGAVFCNASQFELGEATSKSTESNTNL